MALSDKCRRQTGPEIHLSANAVSQEESPRAIGGLFSGTGVFRQMTDEPDTEMRADPFSESATNRTDPPSASRAAIRRSVLRLVCNRYA